MPACITRALAFSATSMANHSLKTDSIHQNSPPIIPTLKRTLSVSVDMASEKWMSQTGLKKSSSLENLQLHQDDDNGGPGSGIAAETEKPKTQTDIWSSILAQNEQDANKTVPPPYIHPLMKRSSSLSEKSLEICTESLGSETGSDCFLSETGSDSGTEEYKEEVIVEVSKETEAEVKVAVAVAVTPVSTCSVKTKSSIPRVGSPARSFPPPLPSLAQGGDGANVQMRSHRENGRLVLEAVSVPTNNCLKARRQDGRLLLTFSDLHVSDSDIADVESEEEEEEACHEFENDEVTESESDVEEEDEEEDDDVACEEGGAHKFLGLTRTVNDATWPRKLNRVVNTLEDNDDDVCYGLNPYVYSWKTKPGPGPIVMEAQLGDDVALEGKRAGNVEEEVITLYKKGCNLQRQPRRSVWEAHCIAT